MSIQDSVKIQQLETRVNDMEKTIAILQTAVLLLEHKKAGRPKKEATDFEKYGASA